MKSIHIFYFPSGIQVITLILWSSTRVSKIRQKIKVRVFIYDFLSTVVPFFRLIKKIIFHFVWIWTSDKIFNVVFKINMLSLTGILVSRIRKMERFELCKEMEKDVFFVLSQVWDKEKILSASMLYHWATRTLWRARLIMNFIYKTWH